MITLNKKACLNRKINCERISLPASKVIKKGSVWNANILYFEKKKLPFHQSCHWYIFYLINILTSFVNTIIIGRAFSLGFLFALCYSSCIHRMSKEWGDLIPKNSWFIWLRYAFFHYIGLLKVAVAGKGS